MANSNEHDGAELDLPSVGDVIDLRYRIDAVHATGGMGSVFRATQLQLDRQVALKVASCVVARMPGGPQRFLREARIATQVQSDHIAHVFDVGVLANGMPYFVMEWLEGSDLAAVLKLNGAMPVATAVDCILQACKALAEVHRRGIIHRDLKPSNLFLVRSPDGSARIKLIDFGVSKVMEMGGADLAQITLTGTAIGSPSYMSPEQMGIGEGVDERTDIWGLGVVLYQLLTSALPFSGDSLNDILAAILLQPRAKASDTAAHVPPGLDAIISRCLDADKAGRFPDVASLAAALVPYGPANAAAHAASIADVRWAASLRPSLPLDHDAALAATECATPSLAAVQQATGTAEQPTEPDAGTPPRRRRFRASRGELMAVVVITLVLAFAAALVRLDRRTQNSATPTAAAASETLPKVPSEPVVTDASVDGALR